MTKEINLESGSEPTFSRLPKTVIPTRYRLFLAPDLKAFTFDGTEVIEINVTEPTERITLNAKELTVSNVYVQDGRGTQLNGVVTLDDEHETAEITFKGVLGKGKWTLFATFKGVLNDKLRGFYRSVWTDDDGKEKVLAVTQFEACDARRAFPCFDEPEFKATFQVNLIVDSHLTAISNGRKLSEVQLDGPFAKGAIGSKKLIHFAETMKMSTYLVAFVVGELESSDPVTVNGTELRIWCVPGKKHLTSFARDAAAFSVAWFEDFFAIPYPGGNKIDFLAIPDFAAGAMENTGCITFRETALLADEKNTTHEELEGVAHTVMHELAHMWFGDLVTMRWWNGLWLNESFATFMENVCVDAWKPEWRTFDGFGFSQAAASKIDALASTHPIEVEVNNPEEIDEIFDVISYEKGCSILYMLERYIGRDTFRDGVRRYLKKHSYGSTDTSDLWDSLEEACHDAGLDVPVRKIMDAWVFTPGHPVISVEASAMDGFITLTQKDFKFLADAASETLWPVPVTVRANTAAGVIERKFLLEGAKQTVYLGEKLDWVVVNAGGSGFYQVRYTPALLAKLTHDMQNRLTVVERFNLVNDAWSCVKARLTSAVDFLETASLFAGETDFNVWTKLLGSLEVLHSILGGPHQIALAKLISSLVEPSVKRLGFDGIEGESAQDKQLRSRIFEVLGTVVGDAKVEAKAKELFAKWRENRDSVDSNIMPAVVGVLAHRGDATVYDEFEKLITTSETPQDSERFLYALAEFRNMELLKRTMTKSVNGEVRNQDAPYLFSNIMGNEVASVEAWKFLKDNWDKMAQMYPEGEFADMCRSVSNLDTPEMEAEVREFFATHPVAAGDMAIAQALESLRINVLLRQSESQRLAAHLLPTVTHGCVAPAPAE